MVLQSILQNYYTQIEAKSQALQKLGEGHAKLNARLRLSWRQHDPILALRYRCLTSLPIEPLSSHTVLHR